MSATIADLAVAITVKGAEKAGKALDSVDKSLEKVASSSLAVKAGIIAAVYGLERLMANVADEGMALKQFADYTGLSADNLQRWQFMARQSGVGAEEMASSIKSVQNAMTDMIFSGKAPAGLGVIADTVGFDEKRARDTFYVMGKLREFAQATKANPDIANHILKGLGISEGTVQMLRTSKVELDKIKPSQLFSGAEISALAKINVEWSNFWNTFQKASGKSVAKHGLGAIQDLREALELVIKFSNQLEKLAGSSKSAELAIVASFGAIAIAISPVSASIIAAVEGLATLNKYSADKKEEDAQNKANEHGGIIGNFRSGHINRRSGVAGKIIDIVRDYGNEVIANPSLLYKSAPHVPAQLGGGGTVSNNSPTITNHFPAMTDPHKVPALMEKQILNRPYRQNPAQGQTN